jgi:hypothetical protein
LSSDENGPGFAGRPFCGKIIARNEDGLCQFAKFISEKEMEELQTYLDLHFVIFCGY